MKLVNNTLLRLSLYFIAVFLTYVVWLYIEKIGPFGVSRDQFQFLRLIEAHFNGTLSWQDFFTSHSEHVKPLYLLGFYMNAILFGMDLRIEFYLGLVALLTSALIILNRYMLSVMGKTATNKFVFFSSIAILTQIFSFNQYASYGFSQLMFGGFVQTLLFVCIFVASDDLWLRKPKVGQLFLVSSLIVFATFSFAGARMPVLLLAVMAAPVILLFFRAQFDVSIVKYAVVILFVGIISLVLYKELSITPEREGHSISKLVSNPKETWMFFSSGIAASIAPVNYFRAEGWTNSHFSILGTILFLAYLSIFYLYLRHKLWKITLVPFMLFAYGIGFALAVTVARYGNGFPIQTALSPRYVFDTQLGFVGVLWMLFLYCGQVKSSRYSILNLSKSVLFMLAVIIITAAQSGILLYEWNRASYRNKAWENVEVIMLAQSNTPYSTLDWPNWYCPSDAHCHNGSLILKKYSLNIFSE